MDCGKFHLEGHSDFSLVKKMQNNSHVGWFRTGNWSITYDLRSIALTSLFGHNGMVACYRQLRALLTQNGFVMDSQSHYIHAAGCTLYQVLLVIGAARNHFSWMQMIDMTGQPTVIRMRVTISNTQFGDALDVTNFVRGIGVGPTIQLF